MNAEERAEDFALVERVRDRALERRGFVPIDTPSSRWLMILSAIPGFAAQWQRVPAAYCEPTDADASVMVVACPCGHRPEVRDGHCEHCDCMRSFLHLASRVFVAFGPNSRMAECVLDTDLAEHLANARLDS